MAEKKLTPKKADKVVIPQKGVFMGKEITLAEAQDAAEAEGIEFIGKTLDQLIKDLTKKAEAAAPAPAKKVVKTPPVHKTPEGVDPAIKAAIDKANADIALAKQKVAEAKEAQKKQIEENKKKWAEEKQAAEEAARKLKEEAKKQKEEAEAKAKEALEANRAENEKKLADAEATLANLENVVAEAKLSIAAAKVQVAEAKKALGQKVAKVSGGGKERAPKDLTVYTPGESYQIMDNGALVEVTCKRTFVGSKSGNTFYQFKTADGRSIKRRCYTA